jgi:tetratricopeptide (TPR) repeat protein
MLLASACAHQGGEPPKAVKYDEQVVQRQQLANRLRTAGDLAASAEQWQILTIIEPDDAGFRQELESTRAAMARAAATNYDNGLAARKRGDSDEAARLMLQVLALEPDRADAMKVLRDIEAERIARVQGARESRVRRDGELAKKNGQEAASPEMAEYRRSYDLEQTIALLEAGDAQGGIRELHRYLKANPKDKAGRRRIADVVFEQAEKLDTPPTRETAEFLYQQAIEFRGEASPTWDARLAATRKTLANEYYEKGMRAYRGDFELAIRHWQTCLKYNPQQANCSLRLKEAQAFQKQLNRIEADGAKR